MNPVSEEKSQEEFVGLLASITTQLMSYIRILAFNNRDDTEEVFQRTCLVLWQKFDQYDREGNFAAWACRMAYFEVLKHREARRKIKLLSDSAVESLADAAFPISEQWSGRRQALSECVEALEEDQAELIKLRYFEGTDVKEIAQSNDRSIHSVYRELSRVHGVLMRCVEMRLLESTS
ncbi:sigma-70 family RNA polymerase sigma factor [Aporhodopirellula aestuarii]|uniref:Sigma-70 family RNA polymerase sigma factor n=1 Tax=Aporhodopirellula aestuarii TaxID=2950107 RepID=A0ABT0U529_9BACT|nr:sigma-70 family RNA polymerase sigma factor [Aporhodopirellula aestuarii]MCM2371784.1 sigma-70 family RNA polymerase sigma factor [Aporhodopirellula aestuarii]